MTTLHDTPHSLVREGSLLRFGFCFPFFQPSSRQGWLCPYWLSCGSPWRPHCVKPLHFWKSLFFCYLLDELQHILWFSLYFFSLIESFLFFPTELITSPPSGKLLPCVPRCLCCFIQNCFFMSCLSR